MKKIFLAIIICFISLSCNHKRTDADFIDLGKGVEQYQSVKEYFQKYDFKITNKPWIKFIFLNNPYNLNENNVISIYINSNLVYRGAYKEHIDLNGDPNKIFLNDKRLIVSMEILTDKTKKKIWLHRFSTKTVFSWNKDYKSIYCGFLSTNETSYRVSFIPQLEEVY